MAQQTLILTLEGITAGDYVAWVSDPEPPALGRGLRSITLRWEPLGDTIEAALDWEGSPPAATAAAPIAGLPLTPEVIVVQARPLEDGAGLVGLDHLEPETGTPEFGFGPFGVRSRRAA
jgi:hypothetical protein